MGNGAARRQRPPPSGCAEEAAGDRLESEARFMALLAVAYDRPITGGAMNHVKAAITRWREGDEVRATLHLALAGLGRLRDPGDAARRLFMTDGLLRAGVEPDAILDALDHRVSASGLAKFDPDQPRVPAGSGRPSGQWTADGAGGGRESSSAGHGPRGPSSGARGSCDY